MCEEDFYKDNGVAYTEENFDADFLGAEIFCDGCFEECPIDDPEHRCGAYKQCREEYETL